MSIASFQAAASPPTVRDGSLDGRTSSCPSSRSPGSSDACFSNTSSATTADPLLISVKAVDAAAYPYYGVVKLNPPRPLREVLDARSVVVSDDLLVRLNVRTGDLLHIGGQDFRIAGVMVSEPDRMTGSLNVGPRVMIARQGLDRTGLITPGSRAAERYLFALPAQGGPDVAQARAVLKQAFPEATIADYRETHPIITRGLDRSTTFLSLIGLI